MTNANQFPWIYPYVDLGEISQRDGTPVYRPAVEVRVIGPYGETPIKIWALVDSGAEHTYASPWIPQSIGVNPHPDTEITVGIGGGGRKTRFADASLRLISPSGDDSVEWPLEIGFFHQWEPSWGVLLGQRGFFSHFTVTMNHAAKSFAVEGWQEFDNRFDS